MFLTTAQAAETLSVQIRLPSGVREWQVRRVFEDGDLPEPPKFGGKRMVAPDLLPAILGAVRARGWLEPEETVK